MNLSRRTFGKAALASTAFAVPFALRLHAASPNGTVRHASMGAAGMAMSDMKALSSHKHFQLVAVCDVDSSKFDTPDFKAMKLKYPDVKIYADWRELLDKEKGLDSVNVSTPDHMHAPIGMSAMNRGLHVYGQKPLTRTIHEARRMAEVSTAKKLVTQMGIQIHSHEAHRTLVKLVQQQPLGKVHTVHSWIGKGWGDAAPRPNRKDEIPKTFNWDHWLGVATERPFLGAGYYHPGNWRKRLDFGTGTFGDMGCHLLDPVFTSLELTAPTTVKCTEGGVNAHNWGPDNRVQYTFPGTKYTADMLALHWSDGSFKPPEGLKEHAAKAFSTPGSLYLCERGAIWSPYIGMPVVFSKDMIGIDSLKGENHYFQFLDAVRGEGKTSAPFAYGGNLTESVLLGGLAMRFLNQELKWDAKTLTVTNLKDANQFVKPPYRKGWEVEGLS